MTQLVAELYDTDHYVWALAQASMLRRLQAEQSNVPLDLDHLAEEIEALAKSERNAVRSQVRRIIEHLLKLEYSPAADPRAGWQETIFDARTTIRDEITPSLGRLIDDELFELYAQARKKTARALERHEELEAALSLPPSCPYTLAEILAEDWFPPAVVRT